MIEPAPQATEDAAKMANLNVLRLIKEPVAAAIAYRRAHTGPLLFHSCGYWCVTRPLIVWCLTHVVSACASALDG